MRQKGNNYPRDTVEQAEAICEGWQELITTLNVPNMSLEFFKDKINNAKAKIEATERLRRERAEMVQIRNTGLRDLWAATKKVRNAAKATFGDNSPEILKFSVTSSRSKKGERKNQE